MSTFYTVQQANDRLPELTRLLLHLQEEGRKLAEAHGEQLALRQKIRGNGHNVEERQATLNKMEAPIEESLRQGIEQLAAWGIQVKDLERGLVDFPALREERTVFLCWELGEPEVAFWHETTTGYASRQPVDDKFE
jgi:hypothetical protein